ncbi:uncharacterized protein CTRU02_202820 [Colletotrichum truncatum]|uniref:Uncharacterized protein n=1 Tax=Colletotrichum truncatum TaxID=5467 RepID=A0ACC3ZLE4_COLTU|nr:uncharacterized protein CTRU02_12914 [Colletotrichum truncatum]XP_036581608.1 uncharacterized protein CTRU02_08658 [Colletotrichum truncatum]KAF6783898.1 hypothetical protein CTRU02_12914 [Colletotrichum truncatum]KAF6789959.1 hypothetical protein CTRU02_08658 [Colletotrichum truncatum]
MKIRYLNLSFFLFYLLLLLYCRKSNYADPSSYFFDPDRAYVPKFSDVRVREALQFLDIIKGTEVLSGQEDTIKPAFQAIPETTNLSPKLCIGIPTWGQRTEQYLPQTLASLVDSLTLAERNSLYITVLIVDEFPQHHPSYNEQWLRLLVDKVLVYDGSFNRTKTANYSSADEDTSRGSLLPKLVKQQKSAYDFAHLFDACYDSRAPFFALIEDDVIASRDWYDRATRAAKTLETKYQEGENDWLYLRLFYSETFLGWNNEEWPIYLSWAVLGFAVVAAVAAALVVFATRFYTKARPQYLFRPSNPFGRLYLAVLGLWMPFMVALYFLAGRLSVQPMSPGLQPMPSYGCCSQGLVFPKRHLRAMSNQLRNPPETTLFPDQIIERWANDQLLSKWALVPSVLQHIGRMSSSTGGGLRKGTWNFRFEAYEDPI